MSTVNQATLSLGARRVPLVLPSRRDPRLRLSVVIVTLQVLGQTELGFKVSIAQILVSVGLAAVIETAVTWQRSHAIVWPASAILTGNSVAFILRATGTRHGDWWTLHGVQYFVLAVLLSLLSKYLIRVRGSHIFNPSNVGLVATLLIIGPAHVFPQYLWWGPLGTPVALALIVIVIGAAWVLTSVRMTAMAAAFLISFASLIALLALGGKSFIAIWHAGPVSGTSYWVDICLSPELLIFVFFMMSDPKTAPGSRRAQVAFGIGTALIAALLVLVQQTEFGIKVAILSSLTVSCALVPLLRAAQGFKHLPGVDWLNRARAIIGWGAGGLRKPAVLVAAIVALAAPIDTISLASDAQIGYIEQGLTGTHNPQ